MSHPICFSEIRFDGFLRDRSTIGAPQRRTIYTASMESHVDALHAQLLEYALYPVPLEKLEPYRGLHSKTAKVNANSSR